MMAITETVTRRAAFKGLSFTALAASLPGLAQRREDDPEGDTYTIIGMWACLTPFQKVQAGRKLRAAGLDDIADALRQV